MCLLALSISGRNQVQVFLSWIVAVPPLRTHPRGCGSTFPLHRRLYGRWEDRPGLIGERWLHHCQQQYQLARTLRLMARRSGRESYLTDIDDALPLPMTSPRKLKFRFLLRFYAVLYFLSKYFPSSLGIEWNLSPMKWGFRAF